jgi:hypothetical protein
VTSRLVQVRPPPLGPQAARAPEALNRWPRLQATCGSVTGLLDTLKQLRLQGDPHGRISERQRDLASAAIVFTFAGVEASQLIFPSSLVPVASRRGRHRSVVRSQTARSDMDSPNVQANTALVVLLGQGVATGCSTAAGLPRR